MTSVNLKTADTGCEFGQPMRRGRVDPAKTLGLIKRIQTASGALPMPTPRPLPIARAG